MEDAITLLVQFFTAYLGLTICAGLVSLVLFMYVAGVVIRGIRDFDRQFKGVPGPTTLPPKHKPRRIRGRKIVRD